MYEAFSYCFLYNQQGEVVKGADNNSAQNNNSALYEGLDQASSAMVMNIEMNQQLQHEAGGDADDKKRGGSQSKGKDKSKGSGKSSSRRARTLKLVITLLDDVFFLSCCNRVTLLVLVRI